MKKILKFLAATFITNFLIVHTQALANGIRLDVFQPDTTYAYPKKVSEQITNRIKVESIDKDIDILFYYTKEAVDYLGSVGAIDNKINEMVSVGSTIFSNTGLEARLTSVASKPLPRYIIDHFSGGETSDDHSLTGMMSALNKGINNLNAPGRESGKHNWYRDDFSTYHPDFVVLLHHSKVLDVCGVASNSYTNESGFISRPLDIEFFDTAVMTVNSICETKTVLAHEIGHRLDSNHLASDPQVIQDSNTRYGNRNMAYVCGGDGYTIMASGTVQNDLRYHTFSNPNVFYNNNTCGHAEDADNFSVFNVTLPFITDKQIRKASPDNTFQILGSTSNIEEGSEAIITISRLGDTASFASIEINVQFITANESDIELSTGTINFLENETVKELTIAVVDDDSDESDEQFSVYIKNPVAAYVDLDNDIVSFEINKSDSIVVQPPESDSSGGGSVGFLFLLLFMFKVIRK